MTPAGARLPSLFGRRVRALRKLRDLTQQQVADRLGMDLRYFGSIERGEKNVTLSTVERIVEALGCDAHELFMEPGVVANVDIPEAEEFADLLPRVRPKDRETLLRVLQSFKPYRPRKR